MSQAGVRGASVCIRLDVWVVWLYIKQPLHLLEAP